MKNQQENISAVAALLRSTSGVDTPVINSLCCAAAAAAAAGITAPSSATAEARIPHEKLRGAAVSDATLTASGRPFAQLVLGYTQASGNCCFAAREASHA